MQFSYKDLKGKMMSSLKNVLIGCGQITWSREMPEDRVLAEIAEAAPESDPLIDAEDEEV